MEDQLSKLGKYKDITLKQLSKESEIVLKVDHICNANLMTAEKEGIKMKNPKTGMVHIVKTAADVIDFNDASMMTTEER